MATAERRVGRPKLHRQPTKLNLSVDKTIKRALYTMATERGMSIGQVVTELVRKADRGLV